MTNKELAAQCLIEAAGLLGSTYDYDEEVLTEGASDPEKITEDIKDAIKNNDDKKLKKSLDNFKKWYLVYDPEDKHNKLRDLLYIIHLLLSYIIGSISTYAGTSAVANIIGGDRRIKVIGTAVSSLISLFIIFKSWHSLNKNIDKAQSKYIDMYVEKYENKFKDAEDKINNFKGDKNSEEYILLTKTYKEMKALLDWYTNRRIDIRTKERVINAKKELKNAKKIMMK